LSDALHRQKGILLNVSIYDGEKYYSSSIDSSKIEEELENSYLIEKNKRKKFVEMGYDICRYEKAYAQLIKEYNEKINDSATFDEKESLSNKYSQKIKNLAKKYLDIDWVE
jgi:hypothetical protein